MTLALLRSAVLAAALMAAAAVPAHAATRGASEVAWREAANDADIAQAFALARGERKPVLLYWGASWCPPCNQLKATLFNRQDFVERSQAFVAVHVDGDLPGAQKLGARFKVRGYPTMILFNPQGEEITRLPGEADAAQVMQVLQLGLAGGRPVKAVLADALAGRPLQPREWQLLAFYSWDTDEQQLVPEGERPGTLAQLAAGCPAAQGDSCTRLLLKALGESDDGKGMRPDAAVRERVLHVLADPAAARTQMDVLTNEAPELVKALAGDDEKARAPLVQAFDAALKRLQADMTLSRADRLTALAARVELARLQAGVKNDARKVSLPKPLQQEVREAAAREDREITDGYERQAVITGAAYVLQRAGLGAESDALLKANLAKSHSPYYLMSELASNAKARGDVDAALRWYKQAWDKSVGPATRLQWGASYVNALIELKPQDGAAIERATQQLWKEAGAQPNAFYERNARVLQRVGGKLKSWNAGGAHAAAYRKLHAQLESVCHALDAGDAQRTACESVMR